MKIDAEKFTERTGMAPEEDELERCNCSSAGKPGHMYCGWCDTCDLPRFLCACRRIQPKA